MLTIVTTLDGSPQSEAVLPVVARLASETKATVRFLTVAAPPSGTPGRSATAQAEALFAVPGASSSIVVERASEPQWAENVDQATRRVIDEGQSYLLSKTAELAASGAEVHADVIIQENVAGAIADYARQNAADLIVMATHGRSGLSELVQGSVASAVVRSGVAPVLLVRPAK